MKYALIGCGKISNNHVVSAINNKLEIVVFCDIVKANAISKHLLKDGRLGIGDYIVL